MGSVAGSPRFARAVRRVVLVALAAHVAWGAWIELRETRARVRLWRHHHREPAAEARRRALGDLYVMGLEGIEARVPPDEGYVLRNPTSSPFWLLLQGDLAPRRALIGPLAAARRRRVRARQGSADVRWVVEYGGPDNPSSASPLVAAEKSP
jgi:hypothetical protein